MKSFIGESRPDMPGLQITVDLLIKLGCKQERPDYFTLTSGGYEFIFTYRSLSPYWDFKLGLDGVIHPVTHLAECFGCAAEEAIQCGIKKSQSDIRQALGMTELTWKL